MKIVIIEDEQLTAEDLRDILMAASPDNDIIKILYTVEEAIDFFHKYSDVDLIFSDIQLGDGLSFEIFKQVNPPAPIVFCTAYDEYALNAFETHGIHYILKPFNSRKIEEAIDKFKALKSGFHSESDNTHLHDVIALLQKKSSQPNTILAHRQDKIVPIKLENIALFYIEAGMTRLLTFEGNSYHLDKTLNDIQALCDDNFYRANRQFIVNKEAISEIGDSLSRSAIIHLNVSFDKKIMVSKERKTEFLNWLGM